MSNNTDLAGWITNTTQLLITQLPQQSYNDGQTLVTAYLSSVGGWVPTDNTNPTGPGQPANGFTEQQAATTIYNSEFSKVYSSDIQVDLTIKLNVQSYLVSGLSQSQVLIQVQESINSILTEQLSTVPVSIVSINSLTGTVSPNGILTASEMVYINSLITSGNPLIDGRAITLNTVRNFYGLDQTWIVSHVYLETNKNMSIIIEKFTTTSYLVNDSTATYYYHYVVDPILYKVLSGSTINYQQ